MVLFLCENSNRWSTKLVTPNLAQNLLSQTDLEANEEVCCVQYTPSLICMLPKHSWCFCEAISFSAPVCWSTASGWGLPSYYHGLLATKRPQFPLSCAKIFPQFWVKICNLCSLALPIVIMHRIWFCTTRAKASARQEVSFPRKWRAGTPSSLSPVRTLTFMWLVAYAISFHVIGWLATHACFDTCDSFCGDEAQPYPRHALRLLLWYVEWTGWLKSIHWIHPYF